ncbi:MAG TPA: GAF domain-containing protein [Verrucomicrobiales bacterium]|nr:GAF domain-containing protein [Verrucomicrobiales bacterium]HIL68869.1 GAF domain-containing protein [Verrucomicrobiota bacterium]
MEPQERERFQALIETARCFSSAMDLNALLYEILERCQSVMHAEGCSVGLPSLPTNELLIYTSQFLIFRNATPIRIPIDRGIAGWVFQNRELINLQDAKSDDRHWAEVDTQTGTSTGALLTIPLMKGTQCLGVMQVLNPVGRDLFDKSDLEIFEAFGQLIVSALVRLEAQQQQLDQQKSQQELLMAREIQNSFMPPRFLPLKHCRVLMQDFPARDVGGDFFVVHEDSEKNVLIGLGDVSGKGMPAALTMARATAIIKARSEAILSHLGTWTSDLNRLIADDMHSGRFISATFLLLKPRENLIEVCTAGQYGPLTCDEDGWKWPPYQNQLPLGILKEYPYQITRLDTRKIQAWLLFSDGITEARNLQEEEYQTDRLLESLPKKTEGMEVGFLDEVVQSWRRFIGGAPRHDDASLLFLDCKQAPCSSELHLTCCLDALKEARRFVECWAEYAGYNDVEIGFIVTACDEASTNILRHTYHKDSGPIHYRIDLSARGFVIYIEDEGGSIPEEVSKMGDADPHRPGGLGTIIINKVFDSVDHQRMPTGNRVTLTKKLPCFQES